MRRKSAPVCVGSGFVALDVIRTRISAEASLEFQYAGGSCSNVLTILAFLGWDSRLVGRIGADAAASRLTEDLRRWGVDLQSLALDSAVATPVVIQEARQRGPSGHRFLTTCPACGSRLPGYRSVRLADVEIAVSRIETPVRAYYFDRATPGTISLARHFNRQGALVLFEPSSAGDERLTRAALSVAHVVKYAEQRLDPAHLPNGEFDFLEVQTLGSRGLRFRQRGNLADWRSLPAVEAPLFRDAAGSGDWCTAGLIYGLVKSAADSQKSLRDSFAVVSALKFGQALAALNCAFDGARGLMYGAGRTDILEAASSTDGRLMNDALQKFGRASNGPIAASEISSDFRFCPRHPVTK